jgi:predicted amidohydrolase YtcJ
MRLDCVKTAFDLNLKPSIHSDFCCQPIGPLRCIHNAVTRKIRNTNKILNVS